MKNNVFTLAVIGFMAGIILAGCGKPSEKKVEKATQDLKKVKAEYLAEWQQFKREAEQKIEANEKTIDQLKEKMKAAGPKLEAQYNKEVAELEQKNRDLKSKLADYKDEGKDKWEAFKQEVSSDLDGLGKALKDFTVDNTK